MFVIPQSLKLLTHEVASYEHTGVRSSGTSKMVICAIGMSEIISGYAMATKLGYENTCFLVCHLCRYDTTGYLSGLKERGARMKESIELAS